MKKILIIGFQRSGTTFLRRLIQSHPEIKIMLHETTILSKCKTKEEISKKIGFSVDNFNWGEKIPYYRSTRMSAINKCDYSVAWSKIFKDDSRIVHIIRHPYDVSWSSLKTFNLDFRSSINYYNKNLPKVLKILDDLPNVLNIKYEDLLTNHRVLVPKIFSFCNVESKIDYEKHLFEKNQDKKSRYASFDESRCFSYRRGPLTEKYNILEKTISLINEIDGPKYEI